MLQPKKTKFAKQRKGRNKKLCATKGNVVSFGAFGLQALSHARLTARQIEASRIVLSKFVKKTGKIWIRVFPDKPITKKPIEVRQGKGKGNVEFWVFLVQPGKVLFELSGVSYEIAAKAFMLASYKLPIKTCCIVRKKVF